MAFIFLGQKKEIWLVVNLALDACQKPEAIVKAASEILINGPLRNKHILITSGPTHEPIDPVRYIANRSSGNQGSAIANALIALGAKVTFISGPSISEMPKNCHIIKVETAIEMLKASKISNTM